MSGVELNNIDRAILASYNNVLEALALYLGEGFEFVLHSLEDYENSAIKVVNGFHTGRSEGCPITDVALEMLKSIENNKDESYNIYCSKNPKGEPMKSTTIAIHGDKGKIIGLLCINFYQKTPAIDLFETLFSNQDNKYRDERFLEQGNDYIVEAVNNAIIAVDKRKDIHPSIRNKEIINILKKQGVFKLKDSVIRCANVLGISKNTVYLHLRTLEFEELEAAKNN